MAHSKYFTTFENKMLHFDDDIELVDILYSTIKTKPIDKGANKLFECYKKEKHPCISRYTISQSNRSLIVRHLKSTINAAYIKDAYEEITIYLRGITMDAYKNAKVSPERIIGDHKVNLSAVDILKGIQDGTLAQTVIDIMFQALENEKSTINLIKKICKKLGITVSDQLVKNAIYYLEIRHKLVHSDGYADQEFRDSHPALKYTDDNYIDLTYRTITSAREAFSALVEAIDANAIEKGIIAPQVTNSKISPS